MGSPNLVSAILYNVILKRISLDEFQISDCSLSSEIEDLTIPSVIGNMKIVSIGLKNNKKLRHIKRLTIQSGIKRIEGSCFCGLPDLEHVTIPSSVNHIGSNAFVSCKSLKIIKVYGNVDISKNALTNSPNAKIERIINVSILQKKNTSQKQSVKGNNTQKTISKEVSTKYKYGLRPYQSEKQKPVFMESTEKKKEESIILDYHKLSHKKSFEHDNELKYFNLIYPRNLEPCVFNDCDGNMKVIANRFNSVPIKVFFCKKCKRYVCVTYNGEIHPIAFLETYVDKLWNESKTDRIRKHQQEQRLKAEEKENDISNGSDNSSMLMYEDKAKRGDACFDENRFFRGGATLYIFKGVLACYRKSHHVISATGIIKSIEGEEIKINVNYCKSCRKFFIDMNEYRYYRGKYGVLLGNFSIDKVSFGYSSFEDVAHESPLHLCGYTVNQQDDLTLMQRQKILKGMMDNGILPKARIIAYLNYFIIRSEKLLNYDSAREKWTNDLNFVRDYKINSQSKVKINSIEKNK